MKPHCTRAYLGEVVGRGGEVTAGAVTSVDTNVKNVISRAGEMAQ